MKDGRPETVRPWVSRACEEVAPEDVGATSRERIPPVGVSRVRLQAPPRRDGQSRVPRCHTWSIFPWRIRMVPLRRGHHHSRLTKGRGESAAQVIHER